MGSNFFVRSNTENNLEMVRYNLLSIRIVGDVVRYAHKLFCKHAAVLSAITAEGTQGRNIISDWWGRPAA